MHILKLSNLGGLGPHYRSIPALAKDENDPVPCARAGHTAVTPTEGPYAGKVVVYGGYSDPETKAPIEEKGRMWVFDPETLYWTHLDASGPQYPAPRCEHGAVAYGSKLIIHGGRISGSSTTPLDTESWQFDLAAQTWSTLPSLTTSSSTPASSPIITTTPPLLATTHDKLYLITGSPDNLTTTLHILDLPSVHTPGQPTDPSDPASPTTAPGWESVQIPTNPLTPGPGLRRGASAHVVSTGMGRAYLLVCMGASTHPSTTSTKTGAEEPDPEHELYTSDIWSLQLPTTHTTIPTPATAKDYVRSKLPNTRSHALEWSMVDIVAKEEGAEASGWLGTARDATQSYVRGGVSGVKSTAGGVGEWARGVVKSVTKTPDADQKVVGEDGAAGADEPTGPVLENNENNPPPVIPTEQIPTQEQPLQPGVTANAAAGIVEGKAHPGPRGWVGATVVRTPVVGVGVGEGPARVVLWGGVNAKGEREGDGWVVELKV